MSIAGGAMVSELDLDVFMKQGLDYSEQPGILERFTRLTLELGVIHPLPVKRTHELMAWVRSGEFDRIVGSAEYLRRGDPLDARQGRRGGLVLRGSHPGRLRRRGGVDRRGREAARRLAAKAARQRGRAEPHE